MVGLFEHDGFDGADVGGDGDVVFGEVLVDVAGGGEIDLGGLVEGGGDAPELAAGELGAGGARVHDAARGEDADHARDANLSGPAVDADLDEVGAEGELHAVFEVGAAEDDGFAAANEGGADEGRGAVRVVAGVLDDGPLAGGAANGFEERFCVSAGDGAAIGQTDGGGLRTVERAFAGGDGGGGDALANGVAGLGDDRADAGRGVGAGGEGSGGEAAVADADVDVAEVQAEEVGGGLGDDGADAGADLVGADFDDGAEVRE